MTSSAMPPRWAERLLRLLLAPEDREAVPGDLLEEYRESVRPARGRRVADFWYVTQVLGFAWHSDWLRTHVPPTLGEPMMTVRRVLYLAIAGTLLFDLLAAIATRASGFHYGWRGPGSILIYAIAAYIAGRIANLKSAILVAASAAVADATVGWAMAWAIGPGRPPAEFQHLPLLVGIVIGITLTGASVGLVGGLFGRLHSRYAAG